MRYDEGQLNPRKFLMISNPGRLPSFQDVTGRNASRRAQGKSHFVRYTDFEFQNKKGEGDCLIMSQSIDVALENPYES